jgi:hypothetical protein
MINPKAITQDHVDLLDGTLWLVKKGLHVPPDNAKALTEITYAYIHALGEANAEIERLQELLYECRYEQSWANRA